MVTLKRPTYVRRAEPLRGRPHRLLTVFASGVRRELKRPLNLVALILAIAFGVIATLLNIFLAPFLNPGQAITTAFFYQTFTNPLLLLFILIVATAVGAGLISDDLRHQSLALYLSRPLTPGDYLLAKGAIVGLAVFLAAAFPGFLAPLLAGLLRYAPWDAALPALGAGLALGLLATGLFATLALLFSSLTVRKGVAAAGTFATVLALQGLGESLRQVFNADEILYLSLYQDLLAVGRALYGVEGGLLDWPVALALLLALTAGSALVAYLRVASLEVVGG